MGRVIEVGPTREPESGEETLHLTADRESLRHTT
jgi:hypothetical protein